MLNCNFCQHVMCIFFILRISRILWGKNIQDEGVPPLLKSSSRTVIYNQERSFWFCGLDTEGLCQSGDYAGPCLAKKHFYSYWLLFPQIYTTLTAVNYHVYVKRSRHPVICQCDVKKNPYLFSFCILCAMTITVKRNFDTKDFESNLSIIINLISILYISSILPIELYLF